MLRAVLPFACALLLATPAAAAGLGSLYACDAQGSSNTTGAVVGGLLGALAGSQVSKNERTLGAVVGAGIGSAIGNSIGCKMDRRAQQDARAAFERALETGRAQTWADASSGASGRIEVLGPAAAPRGYGQQADYGGRWRFAEGVLPVARTSSAGGTYVGDGRVNVRASPSPQGAVVDRLQPGEQIEVAGAVAGGAWLAVVEDGLVQGYVAAGLVRATGRYGAGAPANECRLVQQTISEPGRAATRERYTACRDARGAWDLSLV